MARWLPRIRNGPPDTPSNPPNDRSVQQGLALRQLGITLTFLGQPKAAIPLVEKSIRLDPRSPNIHVAYWALGCCHLLLGHVDEAVDLFRKARAADPRLAYIQFDLASALGLKRRDRRGARRSGRSHRAQTGSEHAGPIACGLSQLGQSPVPGARQKTLWLGRRRVGLPDE
jgi:adenylate cyclase